MKFLPSLALPLLFSTYLFAAPASTTGTFHTLSPTTLDVNAGVLAGGGDALPGANAHVRGRLNTATPLFLGGEVGMFVFSNPLSSGIIIPLLASLSTEFEASPSVHPTVGLSAGPALSTSDVYSTARFMLLFNPGVEVDLGNGVALNALARLGALGSTFVALPQLGLLFAI